MGAIITIITIAYLQGSLSRGCEASILGDWCEEGESRGESSNILRIVIIINVQPIIIPC